MSSVPSPARRLSEIFRSASAHRFRWGVIDQGFSSLTNFAVTAVAAHEADQRHFGTFSVAFTLYILFLWIGRSLVSEPFVVRQTREAPAARAQEGRRALGAALVLASVMLVAMALLAGLSSSTARPVLFVMALAIPVLLIQDTYRYVLTASGRTRAAAANDGLWLLTQTVLIIGLLATGHGQAAWLLAAFGAAAAVAALVGSRQTALVPAVRASWRWLAQNRDLGLPFVWELIVISGAPQIALLGIAATGGVVTVGALRAALLLLSPVTVIFAGVFFVALPEAVRLAHRSVRDVERLVVAIGVGASLIVAVWTLGLALIPTSVGRTLLGANWEPGRHVLVPMAVLTGVTVWVLAVAVGLRAFDASRRTLALRSALAPLIFVSGVIGDAFAGAMGAAVALAAVTCGSAILSWTAFELILRERLDRNTSPSSLQRIYDRLGLLRRPDEP